MSEFNYKDNVITEAEGVLFNVRMIAEGRYANGDGSFGVHNPFLAQSLLTASIDVLKARYGLAVSPRVQALIDRINSQLLRQRIQLSAARR